MRLLGLLLLVGATVGAQELQPVQITQKPIGLVHGDLYVPVTVRADVERVELVINGVRHGELRGRSMIFKVPIGKYLRRLRIRAIGYDQAGAIVGDDEVVINDPQPPFRLRLHLPPTVPESGPAELSATVSSPRTVSISGVDFFVGELHVGTDTEPPYSMMAGAELMAGAHYARAVARTAHGEEAHDVRFWGSAPFEKVEVNLQQIPLSVSTLLQRRLTAQDLRVYDDGRPRRIEGVVPAHDLPLNIILLIDSSESMLQELPILQRAAREFAASLIRPQDRIAVVGFHERLFWLTGFTSNLEAVDQAIDRLKPVGQTHLYDSVIAMLFELQKMEGRRALVVLTDGVNQGGNFELDHLVHYARYSGVPVYPIIKNRILSRLMRFGIGRLEARRFARIARETGATYFIIERTGELPAVYRRIADELRQQYLMMFYAEGSGSDVWHSLRVEPALKGLSLRAPTGYFP